MPTGETQYVGPLRRVVEPDAEPVQSRERLGGIVGGCSPAPLRDDERVPDFDPPQPGRDDTRLDREVEDGIDLAHRCPPVSCGLMQLVGQLVQQVQQSGDSPWDGRRGSLHCGC